MLKYYTEIWFGFNIIYLQRKWIRQGKNVTSFHPTEIRRDIALSLLK